MEKLKEIFKVCIIGIYFFLFLLFGNIISYSIFYFLKLLFKLKSKNMNNIKFNFFEAIFKFSNHRIYILLYISMILIAVYFYWKFSKLTRKIDKEQFGKSRFTTLKELEQQYIKVDEIETPVENWGGIPISRYKNKIYIDDNNTHALVIGTTRSGKGQNFLFPFLDIISRAKKKPSAILFDPKGEFASSSYETFLKRGYNVEILNFLQATKSMKWNPLELIKKAIKNNDFEEAINLCNALSFSILKSDNEKEEYWTDSAMSLVNGSIISKIEEYLVSNEEHKANMYSIVKWIIDICSEELKGNTKSNKINDYIDSLPGNSQGRLSFATFRTSEGKTRSSALSVTLSKLQIFLMQDIIEMITDNSIDLENIGFNTDKLYKLYLEITQKEIIELIKKEKIVLEYKNPDEILSSSSKLKNIKNALLDISKFNLKLSFKIQEKVKKDLYTLDELIYEILSEANISKENKKIEEEKIINILNNLYIKGYINDFSKQTVKQKYKVEVSSFYKPQNVNFRTILNLLSEDEIYTIRIKRFLDTVSNNQNEIVGIYPLKSFKNSDILNSNEKNILIKLTERFLDYLDTQHELELKIQLNHHLEFSYIKKYNINNKSELLNIYNFLYLIQEKRENEFKKLGINTIYNFKSLENEENFTIRFYKLFNLLSKGKSIFEYVLDESIKLKDENILINQEKENKPSAIFLVVPDFDKSRYKLSSLFIEQVYYILAKKSNLSDKQTCDRRLYIVWDEFGNSPIVPNMDNKITVSLSRNIIFLLIIQSFQQLEKYKEAGKIIKENCGNTVYILSSDKDTREEISARCGNKTLITTSFNKDADAILNKTLSDSSKEERLIKPEDLERININDMIILRLMKRTDLKGNKIIAYPIYNTGKTSTKPSYKYLSDYFPQNKNINDIINKKYGYRNPKNLSNL